MHIGGVSVSLILHGLFILALVSIAPRILETPQEEPPITVEIIPFVPPPPPLEAPQLAEPEAVPPPVEPAPPPEPPKAIKQSDGMIHSNQIYSGEVLQRPENEEGLRDYRNLAPDEQREQLCSLEALEQIAAWSDAYKPERMVTYSFGEVQYKGNHMIANGAVFWSHDNWLRVKFDCVLSTDQSKVESLAFAVGTIVPKSDWEEHYLNKYE
nr:DUF930 domain-containing protein [uncultured Cohaesibacter sp.]